MRKALFPFLDFMRIAPNLCMAFKGTLPSELWLHYSEKENGRYLLELDLTVAMDINDQIREATSKAGKGGRGGLAPLSGDDASGVIARRNARREERKRAQQG